MKRFVSIALSILLVFSAFAFSAVAEEISSVEKEALEILGTASDDAKFDYVIDAPEYYRAGDEITVTVSVRNITAENGLHVVEFLLHYNNENLVLTNDLDEEDNNALVCIETLPKGWENLSNVANDYDPDNADAEVKPLNNGIIDVIVLTDKTAKSAAVKDDDVLVFTFTFKALEDAEDDLSFVIPHAEAEGAFNIDSGADRYAANGDCAITERKFTTVERMIRKLGAASEDAKLDFEIEAPQTYEPGDDITVNVYVNNITAENGIHVVEFKLYYDNDKLLLTNDIDEEDYNALVCIETLPKGWENLSTVANDYDEDNEEGTEVKPLNNGVITAVALTDKTAKSAAVKDDGVLVFTFTFKVLEGAEGDLGFVIPHAEAEGAFNTDIGADIYAANGSYTLTHTVAVIEGYDPDCVNTGLTNGYYCPDCGVTLIEAEIIPALGHDKIHHEGIGATCTEIGWYEYDTCSRCDYTTYEEIASLGHNIVHHDAKAPTCTEIGWEAYDTCSRCDYTTYVEIKALGHDTVKHDAKAPTCTEIGWEAYETCTRCDHTTYEEIEALGHDHKAIVTAPTCTEKGFTTYTCHCGDSYVDDYVDALGHDDGEWVTTVEPTLDSEGAAELRCTACGTVLDEKVLPALRLLGDINGDGKIDKYDYIAVKRNVMNTLAFDENQAKAADINGNGTVDKYDYVLVKRHVMGTYKIEGAAK